VIELKGWEWYEDEEFEVEAIIGKMIADGGEVEGRGKVRKGTVLYRVLWEGYPPEIATWENRRGLPVTMVDAYEAALEAEADLEAEEAREIAEEEEAGSAEPTSE